MGFITAILASGPARKALGLVLAAITIALFLLNLRRAGERTGRLVENACKHRRRPMTSNARCSRSPAAALLIAMLWLSGCATASSDACAPCPPVVPYSATDQARATAEVAALPEGAVVVRILSDYAVLRDQARVCAEM